MAAVHDVLAHFAEAEAAVEEQGVVGATFQQHFAEQLRVAQFRVALHVGVQRAADATAAAAARHHDAVDVEEMLVARTEPGEVVAVVRGRGPETDEEASQRAVALGDAEIFGGIEEAAELGRVERQDRGAGGVVEG